tara:strand:- start:554 stop:1351 length:798 start_codon:yes stop_codon:yes gene_type:complete
MPVYNCEKYIRESIKSVLYQTHQNWELLIINDGSIDSSKDKIKTFRDNRIRYFEQMNTGVSAARNLALQNMCGIYFCFLDADDVMPSNSLKDRLNIFESQRGISFVDGVVVYMNDDMEPTGKKYVPSFNGYPYNELLKLSNTCYFGNTWMIKRDRNFHYRFNQEMTHAEDLFFYLTISKGRKYSYTESPVLFYRERDDSAMKDLTGLEDGYFHLLSKVKQDLQPDPTTLKTLKKRIMRIMFFSYLFDGHDPYSAARSLFRYLLKA